MIRENKSAGRKETITPAQIRQIQELAGTIRYGSITLVFQDGALIQIDKSEKIRKKRKNPNNKSMKINWTDRRFCP